MLECPNCRSTRLVKLKNNFGFFWACPKCEGRAVSLCLLRKTLSHKFLSNLWNLALNRKGPMSKHCPMCGKYMYEINAESDKPRLDVCQLCQFVWFDSKEYEQIPEEPASPVAFDLKNNLPPEAREKLALQMIKKVEEDARHDNTPSGFIGGEAPEEAWKCLPAMFGMPVEYENRLNYLPLATWSLVALISIVSILSFPDISSICNAWGFIPNEPLRFFGATFLTSFFLHGGWLHLVGNMYFLLIFGDNVEDFIGKRKFLLLLLTATLAGDCLHMIFGGKSETPCIGASGGISGIITFYALQFPSAKLGILIRYGYVARWVSFPAIAALLFWILLQSYGAWEQISGFTNVSSLAHIGGAATGFAFWLFFRIRKQKEMKGNQVQ